jgi:hypothetical protein
MLETVMFIVWVAELVFHISRGGLFFLFDADDVMSLAQGALGIIALFLQEADLPVETGEDVDHAREVLEVSFYVLGSGGFLEQYLGKARGRGLKADFRNF